MKRKNKPCPLCESGDTMRLYTIKAKTPEEEGKYSVYVAKLSLPIMIYVLMDSFSFAVAFYA